MLETAWETQQLRSAHDNCGAKTRTCSAPELLGARGETKGISHSLSRYITRFPVLLHSSLLAWALDARDLDLRAVKHAFAVAAVTHHGELDTCKGGRQIPCLSRAAHGKHTGRARTACLDAHGATSNVYKHHHPGGRHHHRPLIIIMVLSSSWSCHHHHHHHHHQHHHHHHHHQQHLRHHHHHHHHGPVIITPSGRESRSPHFPS